MEKMTPTVRCDMEEPAFTPEEDDYFDAMEDAMCRLDMWYEMVRDEEMVRAYEDEMGYAELDVGLEGIYNDGQNV
jgi:hypothetical protein